MVETVIINPVTRISGFMQILVEVENHVVVDTKCSGLLFRGFEKMLRGRAPLDSIYFTERICGICSAAHSMASTLALEDALLVKPDVNGKYIRDFMHGCEFLQNHIRHFYQYTMPDFVKGSNISPLYDVSHNDFRLSNKLDKLLSVHYTESFKYSRLAHEMLAVLGGKAPHNHGIFVGGVTVNLDSSEFIKVKSILESIRNFIQSKMIHDAFVIGDYYPEYYSMGVGWTNLLSYGVFDYPDKDTSYIEPSIYINGVLGKPNLNLITESIYSSWYKSEDVEKIVPGPPTEEDTNKEGAYSWVKSPRYNGLPMEVGPLARMHMSGKYTRGISTMDRTIARVLEAGEICDIMIKLLERIELKKTVQKAYEIPDSSKGAGLIDTTRGSLGHWVEIQNKKIKNYDIITPTAWNLSPEDINGVKGPMEKALLGTYIENIQNPIELGRIARSFDPCVSCATHVTGSNISPFEIRVT